MIPIIRYPPPETWPSLLKRPADIHEEIQKQVLQIIEAVQNEGDKALLDFAARFDKQSLSSLSVSPEEWDTADDISTSLKGAIDVAMRNIRTFHTALIPRAVTIETMPGIQCSSRPVAIEKVGLYIPGGTAPLYSTLMMLGIPAQLAGCKEIVVCTPPDPEGKIAPPLLYIARQLGITQIFKTGGAQAIAAMAYGAGSIPQVNKIFGPGNQYVTTAKMLLQSRGIAIDMPAGPSEVAVLADDTCVPAFVAADLLSQAEHGADSQVILVSDSSYVLEQVQESLVSQLKTLPRSPFIEASLSHSKAILVQDIPTGIALLNQYAPEHLIIACRNEDAIAEKIYNAGSVFLGNYAPESAGDYASGTNHTLPTNGYAKAYSGVSVSSFMKTISFQKITREGLGYIADTVVCLAQAEGLEAHANAITVRIKTQSASTSSATVIK